MSMSEATRHALVARIEARDRTIARLEAELKDKREALALEIIAHEKTLKALRDANEAHDRIVFGGCAP